MNTEQMLNLVSAIVFLAIALVATLRRARSPLAVPLGLMGACMFAYNLFELISTLHQPQPWDWAEDAAAALSAIPTLELFLGFVGMSRRLRLLRYLNRAYFGLVAVLSLWRFVNPRFLGDAPWAEMMLGGIVVVFSVAGYCLVRHVMRSRGLERARAQLLFGSLLLGVGGVTTDLSALIGADVPKLAAVGITIASLLIAALILGAKVLKGISRVTLSSAGVIAALAVIAQLVVAANAGTNTALMVVGTCVVAVVTVSALRPVLEAHQEERAREQRHAIIGRFAEQMAHDLRNPLAAIRGAAQFLQEERAQGRSIDEQARYMEIIVDGSQRLEQVIADYQRIGRVEPQPEPIEVDALLDEILDGQSFHEGIRIERAFADRLPAIAADRALLALAMENLVRNACEAMPEGGCITVSSEYLSDRSSVRIVVADDGPGMDARTREHVFDRFFTTKASGSGLGLAMVARVVEAHGGSIVLESEPGEGTRVVIELPVEAAREP